MHSFRLWSLILPSVLALGCADAEPPDDIELVERSFGDCKGCVWGPPVANTGEFNGFSTPELNIGSLGGGFRTEGIDVLSVVVGTDPYQEELEALWSTEGIMFGIGVNGSEFSGSDFIGSVWEVEDGRHGGAPMTATLNVVDFIEEGPRSRYTFTYSSVYTEGVETPLCVTDPETSEQTAIVFEDLHIDEHGTMSPQPDTLYFGCISGAVGKAAMWGYSPVVFGPEGHQAATRAVMADYCGDGSTWTVTGTPLQVKDVAGIRNFPASSLDTEALWTPTGAACVGTPRLLGTWSYEDISCDWGTIPQCEVTDSLDTITDALLWTKVWESIP